MSLADEHPTEHDLVIAARAGSETAWTTLVERYYPLLSRYLTAHTGDAELAADLAQDAFVVALTHLYQPSAERDFGAWLYRIAQNRLRAVQRRQRLRRTESLDWLRERLGQAEEAFPTLHEADELAAIGERELIEQVLANLSPALREALLLHNVQGLSGSEVAARFGISVTAAEHRISRAQAQFRMRYNALVREAAGED